jgi:hypothetical protein
MSYVRDLLDRVQLAALTADLARQPDDFLHAMAERLIGEAHAGVRPWRSITSPLLALGAILDSREQGNG